MHEWLKCSLLDNFIKYVDKLSEVTATHVDFEVQF